MAPAGVLDHQEIGQPRQEPAPGFDQEEHGAAIPRPDKVAAGALKQAHDWDGEGR